MLATHAWAEKKGLPGVAILASAFETSVNILAYEKGRLPVAKARGPGRGVGQVR